MYLRMSIMAAAITAFLGVSGFAYFQTMRLDSAKSRLELARSELHTCGGRLDAVLRDVRSDNEIDDLPDSALVDVPDHWLRSEGGADSP